MESKVFTTYSHAWAKYRRSKECKGLVEVLAKSGIKAPYSENILRQAFDAGWGDRKIEIIKH